MKIHFPNLLPVFLAHLAVFCSVHGMQILVSLIFKLKKKVFSQIQFNCHFFYIILFGIIFPSVFIFILDWIFTIATFPIPVPVSFFFSNI